MTIVDSARIERFGSIPFEHLEKFEIDAGRQEVAENALFYIDEACEIPDKPVELGFSKICLEALTKHYKTDPDGLSYGVYSIIHKSNGEKLATSLLKAYNGEDFGIKPIVYAETHHHETGAFVLPVNGTFEKTIYPIGLLGRAERQKS